MKRSWVQLKNFRNARVMLILPCNAAAYIGNYFQAEIYSRRGWNTWREADAKLRDLRTEGIVAFGALDSSTLETKPEDPRGAIVLETEMHRAANPDGEDWGAPSWRWFRPTPAGKWNKLEKLTDAVIKGVLRINGMGIGRVVAVVNPRAYFLALAAAVRKCGLMDQWILFRTPAHPRFLIKAVREVSPFVRAAARSGVQIDGGIYIVPSLYSYLKAHEGIYRHVLPEPWREINQVPSLRYVSKQWNLLAKMMEHSKLGGDS